MKCEQLRQEFIEVVLERHAERLARDAGASAQLSRSVPANWHPCSGRWACLTNGRRRSPSPYFATRLQARMREESLSPTRDWFAWLRRPALAAVAAVLIVVGVGLLELNPFNHDSNTLATKDGSVVRVNAPGTAVSDLQYLDKNADLFADFDALDGQSSTE